MRTIFAALALLLALAAPAAADPKHANPAFPNVPSCKPVACIPVITPAPACKPVSCLPVPAIAVPCTPAPAADSPAGPETYVKCKRRQDGRIACPGSGQRATVFVGEAK